MRIRLRMLLLAALLMPNTARADEDSSEDVDWLMRVTRDMPRAERTRTERE